MVQLVRKTHHEKDILDARKIPNSKVQQRAAT